MSHVRTLNLLSNEAITPKAATSSDQTKTDEEQFTSVLRRVENDASRRSRQVEAPTRNRGKGGESSDRIDPDRTDQPSKNDVEPRSEGMDPADADDRRPVNRDEGQASDGRQQAADRDGAEAQPEENPPPVEATGPEDQAVDQEDVTDSPTDVEMIPPPVVVEVVTPETIQPESAAPDPELREDGRAVETPTVSPTQAQQAAALLAELGKLGATDVQATEPVSTTAGQTRNVGDAPEVPSPSPAVPTKPVIPTAALHPAVPSTQTPQTPAPAAQPVPTVPDGSPTVAQPSMAVSDVSGPVTPPAPAALDVNGPAAQPAPTTADVSRPVAALAAEASEVSRPIVESATAAPDVSRSAAQTTPATPDTTEGSALQAKPPADEGRQGQPEGQGGQSKAKDGRSEPDVPRQAQPSTVKSGESRVAPAGTESSRSGSVRPEPASGQPETKPADRPTPSAGETRSDRQVDAERPPTGQVIRMRVEPAGKDETAPAQPSTTSDQRGQALAAEATRQIARFLVQPKEAAESSTPQVGARQIQPGAAAAGAPSDSTAPTGESSPSTPVDASPRTAPVPVAAPTVDAAHQPAPAEARLTGTPSTDVQRQEGAEQIVRVLRAHVGARNSQVTIQLDPPELGRIRIDIRMQNNLLFLNVETDTAAGRELLNSRLGHLREILQQQGVTVERAQVQMRQAVPDVPQGREHQQQPQEQSQHPNQRSDQEASGWQAGGSEDSDRGQEGAQGDEVPASDSSADSDGSDDADESTEAASPGGQSESGGDGNNATAEPWVDLVA